jgi:hypothetical protein
MPAYYEGDSGAEIVVVQSGGGSAIGIDPALPTQSPFSLDRLNALGAGDGLALPGLSAAGSANGDPLALPAIGQDNDISAAPGQGALDPAGSTGVGPSDLVRMLVNVRPGGNDSAPVNFGPQRPGAARQTDDDASGLGSAILNEFSNEIVEAMTGILRPAIGSDGVVTFTIGGFGNFMIMADRGVDSFQVIDVDQGTTVNFHSAPEASRAPQVNSSDLPQQRESQFRRSSGAGPVAKLKAWIANSLTNPFFLTGILLLVLLWVAWRIFASRSNA